MLNVGIGLTSMCNCNCSHCYSRIYGNNVFLNKERLLNFLDKFLVKSINFGTGESWFHPDFIEIIQILNQRGIEISLTTNGYTISKLDEKTLRILHDVDFSLDYPQKDLHDKSRQPGCFELVKKV